MKLEDQVCSLELAKRLKELGVRQESLYCWIMGEITKLIANNAMFQVTKRHIVVPYYSAFTVPELGEMLPNIGCLTYSSNFSHDEVREWRCIYATEDRELVLCVKHEEKADTEANARAKMFIHLIEKGIVKP